MAKLIEYDVSNVESTGGGTEQPKPAVYPAVIRICEQRDTKADGSPANDLRVALDLGGDYAWLFTYIGLGEASEWKLQEFISALGLKAKGKLDPDKMVGKMIRVKVNPDTYEGAYTARAGRLMKAIKGDVLPEAGEVSEDGAGPEDEAEPEAEASGDEEFIPSREGEDHGSYEEWDDADLEAEVEDRELTVVGGRGKKRDKWIKTLRDDDSAEASEPGDDDHEEEETSAEGADDYDEWEAAELEAEFKDRELELPKKPRGSGAADRYKEALITKLREDNDANPFEDE
jgi:hypothetical protein